GLGLGDGSTDQFHEPRVDVGYGPKNTAPDGARASCGGVPGDLGGGDSVDTTAGGGGDAVGHHLLIHYQKPTQARQQYQQVQQDEDGHVVGQVDHERRGFRSWQLGDPHGVVEHDGESVGQAGGAVGDRVGEGFSQYRVDPDRGHVAYVREQGKGEGPQARADLDDDVVDGDTGN